VRERSPRDRDRFPSDLIVDDFVMIEVPGRIRFGDSVLHDADDRLVIAHERRFGCADELRLVNGPDRIRLQNRVHAIAADLLERRKSRWGGSDALPVIEGPVVVVKFQLDVSALGNQPRFLRRSVAPQKGDSAAAPFLEIVAKPIHDLRRVNDLRSLRCSMRRPGPAANFRT